MFSAHSAFVGFTGARPTYVQENLEGHFELRKTFEIALVSLTAVRLTSVQEIPRGRPDAARPAADAFESIFGLEILYNLRKYHPTIYQKIYQGKTWTNRPKGCKLKLESKPKIIEKHCQNK